MQDVLLRLRYRYWPDHLLGEILSKRWTETAIPVIVLLIITILLSRAIPGFLTAGGLADTGRQAGEIGFVVLGIALVVIVGGIDLSVGSMFALCDFCALFCLNVLDWPVPAGIVATVLCGAALGVVNGLLIGYLRLRAFITTLITLIIYRSAYDLLLFDYSNKIAAPLPPPPPSPSLTFPPGISWAAAGSWACRASCWSISLSPCSGMSSSRVCVRDGMSARSAARAARPPNSAFPGGARSRLVPPHTA